MILDGVWLWVWPAAWGGTDLSVAAAMGYQARGIRGVIVKAADGVEQQFGSYAAQKAVATAAGLACIPWDFGEPGVTGDQQASALVGVDPTAPAYVLNLEVGAVDDVGIVRGVLSRRPGVEVWVGTWGNPQQHSEVPYAALEAAGVTGWMPEAYPAAWRVSDAAACQRAATQYAAMGLRRPVRPITDQADLATFAGVAAGHGWQGVSAWRHGAPFSPASVTNAASVYQEPTMADVEISSFAGPDGSVCNVGKGTNGAAWFRESTDQGKTWSTWVSLGGIFLGAPSGAVALAPGQPQVIVLVGAGTDSQSYVNRRVNGTWTGWVATGGLFT